MWGLGFTCPLPHVGKRPCGKLYPPAGHRREWEQRNREDRGGASHPSASALDSPTQGPRPAVLLRGAGVRTMRTVRPGLGRAAGLGLALRAGTSRPAVREGGNTRRLRRGCFPRRRRNHSHTCNEGKGPACVTELLCSARPWGLRG